MNMVSNARPALSLSDRLLLALCLLAALTLPCSAQQEPATKRGFQPGGSYAIGDIETVNTTNGNLMLRLPLAQLPPGRGGSPGRGVTLWYNSKLWQSRVEYRQVPSLGGEISPDPNNPNSNLIPVNLLQATDAGGWHLGYYYYMEVVNRNDEYAPHEPPCALDSSYIWKVTIVAPDGGSHDMRPLGYSDYQNNGYYQIDPNGRVTVRTPTEGGGCYYNSYQASTSGVTYEATDGSNLRLFVPYDGDQIWQNNPWTLYMPDGGRFTGGNGPLRFYDRNNNSTEIQSVTLPDGTGATRIVDQLGRYIQMDSTGIWTRGGDGKDVRWRIEGKEVWVHKQYKPTDELGYNQPPETLFHPMWVVDRVVVPDPYNQGERAYTFGYNVPSAQPAQGSYTEGWGELQSVTLPTGAAATYHWRMDGPQPLMTYWRDVLANAPATKTLTYQQEHDNVASTVTENWSYSFFNTSSQITAPDGGTSGEAFGNLENPTSEDSGRTLASSRPDGSLTERLWLTKNLVKTEFTSIRDANNNLSKTAIKDYQYDCFGNVTRLAEYDWVPYASVPRSYGRPTGLPPNVQPRRVTVNTYYAPCQGNPPLNRQAVKSTEVSEGSQILSRTEFTYDDPLTTANLMQQRSWDSAKGVYTNPLHAGNSVAVTNQYDSHGNLLLTTDARGTQTHFTYGPVGGFTALYPTETKKAYGTAVQRTTAQEYDFHAGLVTRSTDVDNGVSTSTAYDAFGRPTLVKAAEGLPEEARTATQYDDLSRRIITRSDKDAAGDGKLVSVQHYDRLGQVRLARQLEDPSTQSATDEAAGIKVQTRYAISGAFTYELASQPYRGATSADAAGPARGWTRTKKDRGGRVVEVETFQGSGLPWPWGQNADSTGKVVTANDAERTTVTDQAGKVNRSVTDALGRLVRVDEPDAAGALDDANGSPVQPTFYDYDALGNLKQVTQGTQVRTFVYSSLSRLTSATKPEGGTVSYTYDAGGNLLSKTDARGVVSNYVYDALGRNLTVDYSDTPTVNPDIERHYDGAVKGKGSFWYDYAWANPSFGGGIHHRAVDEYDALGRPKTQRVRFNTGAAWGSNYAVQRTYGRAGQVLTQTYPSGRTVIYSYDAAGRLSGFTGNLGDGTTRAYSTGLLYDESNRMRQERFGTDTPVYNKHFYNSRGQLAEIRVSTHSITTPGQETNWNRGAIINHYSNAPGAWGASGGGPDNNGNLLRHSVFIPADDQITGFWNANQFYDYDSLNRLDRAREEQGGTVRWVQDFDYDRWGNRTVDQQNSSYGIPRPYFAVNAANNRLVVPAGQAGQMNYDAAGNLINDSYAGYGSPAGAQTRFYDAENRMVRAQTGYAQAATYTYDADGRRVKRSTGAEEVWQVHGMDGELLAEYAPNALPSQPRKEYGYRAGELLVTAGTGAPGPKLPVTGVAASLAWGSFTPEKGADGDPSTSWIAGGGAPQWIQLDLGQAFPVSKVRLLVNQDPAGNTTHQVYGGATPDSLTLLGTLSGFTQSGQWLELPASAQGVRYVRVFTTASPSWVAWTEVEVYGQGGGEVEWLVSDHLGTPRMTFDKTGSLAGVTRHDYFPFGEEISAGASGRTTAQGYSQSDGVRQQYTGQERDQETGMDYFLARFYSASQGRFTSVDPKEIGFETDRLKFLAYLSNPQNWNRYSYVLNNPLALTDPDGREPNKNQAATIQQIVAIIQRIERENPNANRREILTRVDEHFREQGGGRNNPRYVYTQERGWIDFRHFFAAANQAADVGEVATDLLGTGLEAYQWVTGSTSGFSYEDLPSNGAGSDFGDDVFDPNGRPVSEQVGNYINNLHPTQPTAAPNFNQLPEGEDHGSRVNQSTNSRTLDSSTNSRNPPPPESDSTSGRRRRRNDD